MWQGAVEPYAGAGSARPGPKQQITTPAGVAGVVIW